MSKNISISFATSADKFELKKFFQHYKNKELIDKRVESYLSFGFTVVAKDLNKIVGIIQWSIKEDPKAGVIELEEFFVLEEYRNNGIGTDVIKYTIESIKEYFKGIRINLRKIYLFVSEDNINARNLYERLGFKNITSAGTLFNDNKIELLYCLTL